MKKINAKNWLHSTLEFFQAGVMRVKMKMTDRKMATRVGIKIITDLAKLSRESE